MKRSRLALAFIIAVVLVGTLAPPASAGYAYRKLTATGWYTIFQTFTHASAGEGCSDFPGWSYKVAMSAYLYNSGGTTFKVQSVTVKYTVTTGRIWADSFVMFGSYSSTRWPASGVKFQGDLLLGGQSKTYYYTPRRRSPRMPPSA